jgi:hypothetical protein
LISKDPAGCTESRGSAKQPPRAAKTRVSRSAACLPLKQACAPQFNLFAAEKASIALANRGLDEFTTTWHRNRKFKRISGPCLACRAVALAGRMATVPCLSGVEVVSSATSGMYRYLRKGAETDVPRPALWPVWLQVRPTPSSRSPLPASSLVCESSIPPFSRILASSRRESKENQHRGQPRITASQRVAFRLVVSRRRSPAARRRRADAVARLPPTAGCLLRQPRLSSRPSPAQRSPRVRLRPCLPKSQPNH